MSTRLLSACEPVVLCMHATLVVEDHAAVAQAPRAACAVAVQSSARKLRPATVTLRCTDAGRLTPPAELTTGACVVCGRVS